MTIFQKLLDDVLLKQFPIVGQRAIQDPNTKPYKGKKNTMPQTVHQTRHDGADHMSDYEDEEGTAAAYKKLLGFT